MASVDGGRLLGEPVGLVVDMGRDLLELVTVLASVVSAEEKLATGGELYAEVGLGTTTVTAILRGKRGTGSNGSRHLGPLFHLNNPLRVLPVST
ncbi:hypothetical protein JK386_10035 [Nocardioides sp. zg-536]|uniref:Uncharacterized protein n=1 Tax=Nocardioides faecalis TaxID=2803858 RepID=A0A938Y6S4_9ACTN|nr:hypothetical protein [Nocardioides faecalis]MBS4754634.1 hypothetical protein [Nocardioides faecalis]QVI59969.1 hypothetical protein KG111_06570 [Nocardioides faecalis]